MPLNPFFSSNEYTGKELCCLACLLVFGNKSSSPYRCFTKISIMIELSAGVHVSDSVSVCLCVHVCVRVLMCMCFFIVDQSILTFICISLFCLFVGLVLFLLLFWIQWHRTLECLGLYQIRYILDWLKSIIWRSVKKTLRIYNLEKHYQKSIWLPSKLLRNPLLFLQNFFLTTNIVHLTIYNFVCPWVLRNRV